MGEGSAEEQDTSSVVVDYHYGDDCNSGRSVYQDDGLKYAIAVLLIAVLMFPIYWMVAGSFMPMSGIMARPVIIPRPASLENYRLLLEDTQIVRWVLNTLVIAVVMVVGSVTVSAMAGYAFATQRSLSWLYWAFLVSIMIPRQVLIIPLFVIIRWVHLSGTRIAAILPALFHPVGIFIYRNYVESIPPQMIDCARIDGASERQVLLRIIAPLSRSALAVLVVVKFCEAMTDFLWQFLVLQSPGKQTLVVGVMARVMMRGGGSDININPIGIKLAAGVVLFLPLLVIFVVLQKHFISGIMTGGVKE